MRARVDCGLSFDQPGGPLVAVCGLVGGSGASTLAFCLARQAASESRAPVLLTEAGDRDAGLAVLAGQATPHSLAALARRVAEERAPEQTFLELEPRLRLIASTPRREPQAERDQLRTLLDEARAAHGLVVVDCGPGRTAAEPVLDRASHIIWTLPATPSGLARAHVLLASDALPRAGRSRELLAAIVRHKRPRVSARALRQLAGSRCERLVLIPYSEALMHARCADRDERLRRALSGLAATLRRSA